MYHDPEWLAVVTADFSLRNCKVYTSSLNILIALSPHVSVSFCPTVINPLFPNSSPTVCAFILTIADVKLSTAPEL